MSSLAGLPYLEFELAAAQRRVKKIKEHPDPLKAASNLLYYELEVDYRSEQIESLKSGKPFGTIYPGPFMRALGLVPWDAIRSADKSYGDKAKRYFDMIRAEGMAEHTCDRTIVMVPMVLSGDFPKPSFMLAGNYTCQPIHLAYRLIAHTLNTPTYFMERKFSAWSGSESEQELKYVVDQYQEMIEFAEKNVPGCKFNPDKLEELLYWDNEYNKYERLQWKLRATVPCPMAGRDAFREPMYPHFYANPAKCVDYMRRFTEEMEEKASKGIGSVQGEERLRLLWSPTAPYFADPFGWLAKRGVAVPAVEMGTMNRRRRGHYSAYGELWHGRKLSPFEEALRGLGDSAWGGLGHGTVQSHIETCRQLKLDGIVYFLQWGCEITNNFGTLISEVAEKELGIPTLILQGRQLDESTFEEQEFYRQLEEFVDICLDAKKKRGFRKQEHGK
ncbi:MAG: 2-hydroxyacyl-CoA dehydratase [Chloroflexi bacterium]|nr:2-hydroxyacyl-CoA dehydratase [Chloroflexota bacterium]